MFYEFRNIFLDQAGSKNIMAEERFQFKKIDAFATENSDGNPAGMILLRPSDNITDEKMQQIAKELKGFVSETGFVFPESDEKFRLKYYSSEKEVNFCGHATIAILYELFSVMDSIKSKKKIAILTNDGELPVENRIAEENSVFIMSPSPKYYQFSPSIQEIASALSIEKNEINTDYPVKIINAGLITLLVPIRSLETVLQMNPDFYTLKEFSQNNQIHIIEVFSDETSFPENDFRVRVFAATFGYLEDPATGSGNSAFGYYLLQQNMWEQPTLRIEQNQYHDRFNIVKLQKSIDVHGNIRVTFGGGAIKRIEGEYILHCDS